MGVAVLAIVLLHNKEQQGDNSTALPPVAALAGFWNWFSDNGERLKRFIRDGNPSAAIHEISDRLQIVCPGARPLVSANVEGDHEFVICAELDPNLIRPIQALVNAAPEIPGWKIKAFRPVLDVPYVIYRDERVDRAEVVFAAGQLESGAWHLSLYVTGMNEQNEPRRARAALLLAEVLVGEYVFLTRIESWDVLPSSSLTGHEDVYPIDNLRQILLGEYGDESEQPSECNN